MSGTAYGCFAILPSALFRTHAVLAIGDGTLALRAAMARVAAESSVSKPVIERAAAALVAAERKAPAPGLAERIGVVTGTSAATSQQARLGQSIASMVRADPGTVPGTVEIAAAASSPEHAAQVADAVADAFVVQQDATAAQTRAVYDAKTGSRLDAARAEALAARRRLIGLGGVSLDPAQARAAAQAQTAAAETRLASVKSMIASGSPPISDRKDLPPVLAVPQATYLDLKAQLDKESQVLGEKHTTIIALRDGLKIAATKLQTEWKRLLKIAEADVATAKEHEIALRKGDTPADTERRGQIEDARRALQIADDAVALAQKRTDTMSEDPTFRLIARAPVPNSSVGMSLPTRLLVSLIAGLAALALSQLLLLSMARRRKFVGTLAGVTKAEQDKGTVGESRMAPRPVAVETKPKTQTKPTSQAKPTVEAPIEGAKAPAARIEATAMRFFDDAPQPATWTRRTTAPVAERLHAEMRNRPEPKPDLLHTSAPPYDAVPRHDLTDDDLTDAMRAILAEIDGIEPRQGGLPTVMVAANEPSAATMPVTLALARVAADADLRVLLIETDRSRPQLAAEADVDAEPVLIDLFGSLRIVLRANDGDGFLTLAPVLRDATRLAADFAMARTTAFIDDLTVAFDLILIDGAVATDAAAAGWTADAFVRVGVSASRRDDEAMCAALGVNPALLLTTILPSDIEPELAAPVRRPFSAARAPRAIPMRPVRAAPPAAIVTPRRSLARR